jgi:two-component system repressor protein LuxO
VKHNWQNFARFNTPIVGRGLQPRPKRFATALHSILDMNTNQQPIVLLIEDDIVTATTYKMFLSDEAIILTHVETGNAALRYLKETVPNVILLDIGLPDMNGIEILKYVQQQQLSSAVVVITIEHSVNIVVETMRYGAFDFIDKPFPHNRLIVTLRNALRQNLLSQKVEFYEETFKRQQYHKLIGTSKPMQTIYHIIDNVATSKASILITGESGTGKELCMEAIHKESRRKNKPIVAINCAAIPSELMESEMFGYVKGAFTGAVSEKLGAAHQADGGTLFLDEIGEMDLTLQTKLLRFVQTGTFRRVGGHKEDQVDVRFICATNCDLLAKIKAGQFREDLYYRLNVIPLKLPALRQRGGDILLLARTFLNKYAQKEQKTFTEFTSEVEKIFLSYDWPGNVRQLQNVIHNIVVLNKGPIVTTAMLPPLEEVLSINSKATPPQNSETEIALTTSPNTVTQEIHPLWQLEKKAIEEAIEYCDGNIALAAKLLEISKSNIYNKLQLWNISIKRTIK